GRRRGQGSRPDFWELAESEPVCWGPTGRLRGPGARADQRGLHGPGPAGGCAAALSPPAGAGLASARPRRPAPVLHPDAPGSAPLPGSPPDAARPDPIGSRPRAHRGLDAAARVDHRRPAGRLWAGGGAAVYAYADQDPSYAAVLDEGLRTYARLDN